MIYRSSSEVDFKLGGLPEIPTPSRVLFTQPNYFAVEYSINPHMEGNIGSVRKEEAVAQWEYLRQLYQELGFETSVIPG
ncbi:MAG: hypothetical protein KJO98_16370, partial [Rhodothermia bacterium]|nr:hypothetical protein [Rhodothermia bacterium]